MYYCIEPHKIVIKDVADFDIEHILDCGQVFRYRKEGDCYTLYAKNKNCLLHKQNDCAIIETDEIDFFENYFDLNRDYSQIKTTLRKYDGLSDALEFGSGIRLLNADPLETIISFIISANNNIPRIKGIIERICQKLGDKQDGFYAFPTLEQLSQADEKFFKDIGAGYRAAYLVKTVKQLQTFDVNSLYKLDTPTARKHLNTLCGVGDKVADCILLFAYKKTDLFPVDTWSKKIYRALGFPPTENVKEMSVRLVERFGYLSGYAQQYLFYYYRENKK